VKRENWIGGTTIPAPTDEKLLTLGRAYMVLLRAESKNSWDMEQLARWAETWKTHPYWKEIVAAYRGVSIAIEAIEEGEE